MKDIMRRYQFTAMYVTAMVTIVALMQLAILLRT